MKTNRIQMAKGKLEIPAFKSEAEEAGWWFANRDKVDKVIHRAFKAGAVKRMTLLQALGGSISITLRIPNDDLMRARNIAEKRGMPYQTFLKALIHQGLEREGKAV